VIHLTNFAISIVPKTDNFQAKETSLGAPWFQTARVGAACVGSTMVGPETRHGVHVRGQDVLQTLSGVYETKWKLQKMDINDIIQKPFI